MMKIEKLNTSLLIYYTLTFQTSPFPRIYKTPKTLTFLFSQSIARCVPGVGLYFCSLDWLKSRFVHENATPTPLQSVFLGAVARCMSGAALIPITVVKTRFESGVYGYSSLTSALREIYRNEGVRGMTCGLVPTLFRDAPFSGLYLMFYTSAKGMVPQGENKERTFSRNRKRKGTRCLLVHMFAWSALCVIFGVCL